MDKTVNMFPTTYRIPRRATQLATLLVIALIPALGVFQIDWALASFHIVGHQIWWSNFFFIFGLAIALTTLPVITYTTIGAVWCGWACPQNLLAEWSNNLTYKFLGKRADVRVDGKGAIVAEAKNKAVNWLILGTIFLGAAMILALVPVLFFYTPHEVWSFVTFQSNNTSGFIQFPYLFSVLLIFIDIAAVRYFMCDYACLYRMGQKMFKSRNALHVSYDASRSADCTKCNYCATLCITDIQPTSIKMYDSCFDCGECIDACNQLHAKSGTPGLLNFKLGEQGEESTWQKALGIVFSRFNWLMGSFFAVGVAMMIWGIYTQPPVAAQVPIEQQLKERQIARVCSSQCAEPQVLCKKGNIAECYRASACKCACSLQQDPGNSASGEWRQCVQHYTTEAEAFGTHPSGKSKMAQ